MKIKYLLAVTFVAVLTLAGCHKKSSAPVTGQKYSLRGKVMSVDAKGGEVSLDTEAIPNFMEAMTMSYKLADPSVISELHPGDKITATLLCDGDSGGCASMRLTDIVVVGQAKPDYKPAMMYHVPQTGEQVPDFKLTNQSAKQIHFDQFKGKVLVMTFVYTRCPLSDYCPRMSRNFAQIDKDLSADKALYAKTHLLTLSFDPEYDTPQVLKSYGEAYTGNFTQEKFAHWDFAASSKDDVKKLEQWFDLGVQPGGDGSLTHSLSTLVIGKDGKVVAFYPTKDWTVDEAEAQIRKAAAA